MVNSEGIAGHKEQIETLNTLIDAGKLPHALCFVGEQGLGKRLIAERACDALTGGNWHRHPDKWVLVREINKKTEKLKKEISVEQIRTLKEELGRSALGGGKKLVIIDEAETLSVAAQNSLLKTLEEPLGDTHVFLIVSAEDRLLPTIQSRCRAMRFFKVDGAEIERLLEGKASKQEATLIATLACGIPGKAQQLLVENPEAQLQSAIELLCAPTALKFARIAELTKQKDPVITARAIAYSRLLLQHILLVQSGLPSELADAGYLKELVRNREQPISRTTHALAILEDIETAINQNCSPALALEHFALAL